jgi:hypothetical protein
MMIFGGNGEGFLDNLREPQKQALSALENPFVVRLWGGADAKWALPSVDKPGLGMSADFVNWFFNTYKSDENFSEDLEKELRKVTQDSERSESYLSMLAELQTELPNMNVIYNCNVFTNEYFQDEQIGNAVNVNAIKYLKENGVNILGTVLGNEVYSVYNFDFDKYKLVLESLIPAILEEFPDMKIGLVVAPEPFNRKDHADWNTKVFAYINEHPDINWAVDVHPYLNQEVKEASVKMPEAGTLVKSYENQVFTSIEEGYDTLKNIISEEEYTEPFLQFIEYVESNTDPNVKIWATEFNIIPAGFWANTYLQAESLFKILVNTIFTYHATDRLEALCIHNLIGNWLWGMFSKVNTKADLVPDNFTDEYISRTSWESFKLVDKLFSYIKNDQDVELIEWYSGSNITLVPDTENVKFYHLPFMIDTAIVNMDATTIGISNPTDVQISVEGLGAQNLYDSSGLFGMIDTKNSVPTQDVGQLNSTLVMHPAAFEGGETVSLGYLFDPDLYRYLFGIMTIVVQPVEENVVLNLDPVAEITSPDEVLLRRRNPATMFELNAYNSFDPDGNIVAYEWYRLLDGEYVLFSEDPEVNIIVDEPLDLTIQLRVLDSDGASSTAYKTITVRKFSWRDYFLNWFK